MVNGGNCRWGDINWVHHINLLDTPKPGGTLIRRIKTHLDYRMYVNVERSALKQARQIVTTCEKNRDDLVSHFGLSPELIKVVYYGNDPGVFRPADSAERATLRESLGWPADRPAYMFVGALGDRRKGFDTLFEAWKLLCAQSDWNANLVVVGDGAERASWEAETATAGLSERITFLGFRRDVPELFRAADAHVLPSRYEGYSLVTQEALSCGLPAFITNTAGIAERFKGELGEALLIKDPNDSAALADQLRGWQNLSTALRPAFDALSEELRTYTWDHMASAIADVFN
jgi:glycosyltransferase involved in cell wall biosynthesis